MTVFDDLTMKIKIHLGYFDVYEQSKFPVQLSGA